MAGPYPPPPSGAEGQAFPYPRGPYPTGYPGPLPPPVSYGPPPTPPSRPKAWLWGLLGLGLIAALVTTAVLTGGRGHGSGAAALQVSF